MHAVQPRVWDVLHLGAFQLVFLTHVPKHAAVNETVELATHIGSPKAKGFINGVMRRIAELVTDEFTDKPGADAVPFDDRRRYRKARPRSHPPRPRRRARRLLRGRVLAAEVARGPLARSLRRRGMHAARLLVQQPRRRSGSASTSSTPTARPTASAWPRRSSTPNRANTRNRCGCPIRRHPRPARLRRRRLRGAGPLLDARRVRARRAAGMHVLDLCSAPGGKTTHLAELMDNRGRITACDIDAKRLETVTALCQRLGVKGVETVLLKENDDPPAGPFDAALVDVPCSNTGVLGRRPEVRWRLKPNEFEYLVRLQTRLLILAAERVKPGGAVVYSTCSIEPEENEGVVKAVLRGMRGLEARSGTRERSGQARPTAATGRGCGNRDSLYPSPMQATAAGPVS